MSVQPNPHGRGRPAFTLIELLVVVAIIALLISILLPSLSKARAQARATLCGSRIAQMAKAVIIYSEDFDGTPPFVGVGVENLGEPDQMAEEHEGRTKLEWAYLEDWLIPEIPIIWNQVQEDWDGLTGGKARVTNGSVFPYARFENLYRCPDFERVSLKLQGAFNYTRSLLGRKLLIGGIPQDGLEDLDDIAVGPIVKTSSIYSPALMFMLIDEQWDFHVAGNYNGDPVEGIVSFDGFESWMGADSIQAFIADCFGSYHGVKGKDVDLSLIEEGLKANVAYYDGHVALHRDPVPGRVITFTGNPLDLLNDPDVVAKALQMLSPFILQIFAQRGADLDPMVAVTWFL